MATSLNGALDLKKMTLPLEKCCREVLGIACAQSGNYLKI